jgi:hypothetical protein
VRKPFVAFVIFLHRGKCLGDAAVPPRSGGIPRAALQSAATATPHAVTNLSGAVTARGECPKSATSMCLGGGAGTVAAFGLAKRSRKLSQMSMVA